MKYRTGLIAVFIFISSLVYGQVDTVYFNANWEHTYRITAKYYRLIRKDSTVYRIEDHYMSGLLQMTGVCSSMEPETKDGYFKYFHENGKCSSEGLYRNNKKEELWKDYDTNGQLRITEQYVDDKLNGEFTTYYSSGTVRRKETYKDDSVLHGTCYDKSGQEITYFPYQIMPQFQGNLNEYLVKHIKYPKRERRNEITGKVIVSFVVEKDGSVSNVIVKTGAYNGPGLDEEAVKVVSKMPKWIPGYQDGDPVRVNFNLPIDFELR
jgi:TonB family protein